METQKQHQEQQPTGGLTSLEVAPSSYAPRKQGSIDSGSILDVEVKGSSLATIHNQGAKQGFHKLATQAQSTTDAFTQKSIPTVSGSIDGLTKQRQGAHESGTTELQKKKRNGSTHLMKPTQSRERVPDANNTMTLLAMGKNPGNSIDLIGSGSRNNKAGALNISQDLTIQEQIQVGSETVIEGKQIQISRQVTQLEEEGVTDRGLQPKYSHRHKNARHLLKMSAGVVKDASRQSSSHLASVEKSSNRFGNFTQNTFGGVQYESVGSQGSIEKREGSFSLKDVSKGGHAPYRKKNSVDQVNLNGLLAEQAQLQVTSNKLGGDDPIKRQSSNKSIDKISERGKLRLDKSVKLHELSRQQLQKQQKESNQSIVLPGGRILPDLSGQQVNSTNTRNTTSSAAIEKLGYLADSSGVASVAQLKGTKGAININSSNRQSVSQLRAKNEYNALQSTNKSKQSIQSLTLPNVAGGERTSSSIHLKEVLSDVKRHDEMLIDDYNVKVNPFQKQAFNKISFKKDASRSKKSLPRNPESKARSQLRDTESSAIRIMKNQQSKFNINGSLASMNLSSPENSPMHASIEETPSAYKGPKQYQSSQNPYKQQSRHEHAPQSAMIQGLLASSASALKVGRSAYTQQSTERNLLQASFLGAGGPSHEQSTSQQSVAQGKIENYMTSNEHKRMKQAQELISQAEMQVTNAQNANNLSSTDVDYMLRAYVESLQTTIVRTTKNSANYSADLQAFVANTCLGIEKSAKLRQKLLDEQIELFEKHKEQFEIKNALKNKELMKMREELNSRPYQKNFDRKEDLLYAQEELESMAKEKVTMTEKVAHSKYSDAEQQLEQLDRMFGAVKKMNVNSIQVSFVDDGLFSKKDKTVGEIDNLIKMEGNDAMRVIAKKVLDQYWRYFETADASTQTEEKVIDALKAQLFEVQKLVQKLKGDIEEQDKVKQELEFKLENEKRQHNLTKKYSGEKERQIEELNDEKDQLAEQILELKERQEGMNSRFKGFTDEINELKLQLFNLNESLKSTKVKLQSREETIDELNAKLKQGDAGGLPQVSAMEMDDNQSDKDSEGQSSEREIKKPVKKTTPAKAEPKQKALAKNSSKKAIASEQKKPAAPKKRSEKSPGAGPSRSISQNQKTPSEAKVQTKIVTKLDPEAEKKLRESISKQLTEQAYRRARAEAQESNKREIEIIEKQANQSVIRKQNEIRALEEKLREREREVLELTSKVGALQKTSDQSKLGASPQATPKTKSVPAASQNRRKSSAARQPMPADSQKSPQTDKTVQDPNQFSIRPTKPKLDSITRTDELTKEKKLVPQTPMLVIQSAEEERLPSQMTAERNSLLDYNQTDSQHKTEPSQHDHTSPQHGHHRGKRGEQGVKDFISGVPEETGAFSIPKSLHSKQENTSGRAAEASGEISLRSNMNSKRFDSADLANLDVDDQDHEQSHTTPPLMDGSGSHRNKAKILSQQLMQPMHSKKVSQGSQVDRSQLQSDSKKLDDQSQNDYSSKMQEKYESQLSSEEQLKQHADVTFINSGNDGNYFAQLQGNLGMNSKDQNDDPTNLFLGDHQLSQLNDDALSDQTLYRQNQLNEKSIISERKRKMTLAKAMQNPQIRKVQQPQVDPPHNLFVESRQYQIKNAGHATFGGEPKTIMSSNRDILNASSIEEGDRMLQELAPPPNAKLQHFTKIVSRAYSPQNLSASVLLEQAKDSMDSTELKLLMLMLQMRGQFDRRGGAMVSKGMQTEGILYTRHQGSSENLQMLVLKPSHDSVVETQPNSGRRNQSVPTNLPKRESYTETSFDRSVHGATSIIVKDSEKVEQTMDSTEAYHRRSQSDERQDNQIGRPVSHVHVQSRKVFNTSTTNASIQAPRGVDIGVQAGDDLIKLSMDRVKLIEKQRHMFFAPTAAGDRFSKIDGTFSPSGKYRKNPVVMKAELLGDSGENDRVMAPSLKQQRMSAYYAHQQQLLQMEAQHMNEQYLSQLEYERQSKDNFQLQQMQIQVQDDSHGGSTANGYKPMTMNVHTADGTNILNNAGLKAGQDIAELSHSNSHGEDYNILKTTETRHSKITTVKGDRSRQPSTRVADESGATMLNRDITKNQSSTTLRINRLATEEEGKGGEGGGLKVVSQRAKESSRRDSSAEPSMNEILPAIENKKMSSDLDYGNKPSIDESAEQELNM